MLRTGYSYGCLMAGIPEPLAGRIIAIGNRIPDEFVHDDGSGEHGRENHPHVTVKFGLNTDDPGEVRRVLAPMPPLKAVLGAMSVFHGDSNPFVVLKMQVEGPDLFKLNKYVSRSLKCTDKWPCYRPHVTVAYLVKNETDPYYYRKFYTDEIAGTEFEVDELEFSIPSGGKYMVPLRGTWATAAASELLVLAREMSHV